MKEEQPNEIARDSDVNVRHGSDNRPGSPIPQNSQAMKMRASKSSERRVLLTTELLCDIWEKIGSDSDGRRALERLDEAGFRISHSKPRDASFKHPSWADSISALPFLPNKPSTRRIHRKDTHPSNVAEKRPNVSVKDHHRKHSDAPQNVESLVSHVPSATFSSRTISRR